MEFLISLLLELPCVFTTNPFKPNIGAPPYSLASNCFNVFLRAGLASAAPILLINVLLRPSFIAPIKVEPNPSYNFNITNVNRIVKML